ncbi:universal stress protein [soil metagenome]
MKDLLVVMHHDRGQAARLAAALDVTRALGAHLTCLDVAIVPELVTDYVSSGGGALLLADEERTEQRNRVAMLPRLREADIPFDWVDVTGDLADQVVAAARLADLVIVNRDLGNETFPDMYHLTGDLLLRARCPILAVDERSTGFTAAGHALVAWDGSLGAAAALRAAMPLLGRARQVTLLTIAACQSDLPAARAASYCGRHGVHPVIRHQPGDRKGVGAALIDAARSLAADYVVMGGYGRHPVREALFGGTTRDMLRHSPVPLLLAHPQ